MRHLTSCHLFLAVVLLGACGDDDSPGMESDAAVGTDGSTADAGTSNEPPTAGSLSATTDEDTPVTVTPPVVDPEGDAITLEIVAEPGNGIATVEGDAITYTPSADFHGTDVLTYQAMDARGAVSNTATLSIVVRSVEDAPVVALPAEIAVQRGIPLVIDASGARDPENGIAVVFDWSISPSDGVRLDTPEPWAATVTADRYAEYEVTVTVTDSAGNESTATTRLHVSTVLWYDAVATDIRGDDAFRLDQTAAEPLLADTGGWLDVSDHEENLLAIDSGGRLVGDLEGDDELHAGPWVRVTGDYSTEYLLLDAAGRVYSGGPEQSGYFPSSPGPMGAPARVVSGEFDATGDSLPRFVDMAMNEDRRRP